MGYGLLSLKISVYNSNTDGGSVVGITNKLEENIRPLKTKAPSEIRNNGKASIKGTVG